MKTVFNNAQVCHVWAQQTQSVGRSGAIFFRDNCIYSYGTHYLAAQIHTVKGQRFALVNSHNYSSTTSRHLRYIQRALSGLIPYFGCADPSNPKAAIAGLEQVIQERINAALKRIKIQSKQDIDSEIDYIERAIFEANELRSILGRKAKRPSKSQMQAVRKHLKRRLDRYNELNPPEVLAKRKAERLEQERKAHEQRKRDLADSVERFRTGRSNGGLSLYGLPFDLLRIEGDTVVTSRGAEVPLAEALELFRAIKADNWKQDDSVGEFTLKTVTNIDQDKVIKIGCHNILLSEAEAVFSQMPTLKLIQGGAA